MRVRALCTLLLLTATAACASSGPADGLGPFSDSREGTIRILVDNRNFSQARLYAIRRGGRSVLGTVGGKQQETFTMEWPLSDQLQIEINMLAGPTCLTEVLPVDPGEFLELQIQAVFTQSAICRR